MRGGRGRRALLLRRQVGRLLESRVVHGVRRSRERGGAVRRRGDGRVVTLCSHKLRDARRYFLATLITLADVNGGALAARRRSRRRICEWAAGG